MTSARGEAGDERLACVYLASGRDEVDRLTHAGLDRRARAVAACLQDRGLAGERALLMYPAGVDFVVAFLGCLYAGVVAVPVPAPAPGAVAASLDRLRAIAADAAPGAVLTTSAVLDLRRAEPASADLVDTSAWVATDRLPPDAAAAWRHPGTGPEDLAFLQYTSGSTSRPKGVMVSHGNLWANLGAIHRTSGCRPGWVVCSWLPNFHDMGLVGGILLPIFGGATVYLMSPTAFVQRPRRWLEAIGRYGVHITGGPNFAYEHCLRRVPEAKRAGLDLSSWEVAFNGSEPLRARTLRSFVEAFAPCGLRRDVLYPTYGLAEATLQVSADPGPRRTAFRTVSAAELARHRVVAAAAGSADAVELVGSGAPAPGFRVAIADPATRRRLADLEVGEIWVAGPSVSAGYWRNAAETERAFGARLAEDGEGGGGEAEGRWFRTGDTGFLADGQLFVIGRIKDLIIVDGRNHYPHDLEQTVEESHPAIRPRASIVFSVDVDDEERVVVVCGVRAANEGSTELVDAVRRRVAEVHQVRPYEVLAVPAGHIPRTSSGKLQRALCRQRYLQGRLEPMAAVPA